MFKSTCHSAHLRLALQILTILISIFAPVQCARSSSSSAESTGGAGAASSIQATSLVPSSTHYRDRGDRELISAQFRAAQDARDLDTSESSISGMELSAAAAHHSGIEEDNLALAKYMAASASTYSPSKMKTINRFNQAGFYDPYPTSGFPSSVPSSYYPYNAYSYRETNPMLDTYPYYERDRIRDLSRAMQAAQSAPYGSNSASSSSSNRDGFGGGWGGGGWGREGFRSSGDHDNAAMSSGHGHDDHGGGHGGWGWGKEYTSKVNTNAIGLLGLLGLLSLLSNVLLQFTTTTTTTTAAARLKRSYGRLEDEMEETREQKMERIFTEILPHLTPIAHAKDGIIPGECTLHGVCMANKVLVNELGVNGRMAAQRISNAVVKLLEKVEKSTTKHHHKGKKHSGGKWNLKKKLESAGLHGRNRKNCEKSYPVCSTLQKQPGPSLPFIIRMQDLPELISKVSSLSRLGGGAVPMDL